MEPAMRSAQSCLSAPCSNPRSTDVPKPSSPTTKPRSYRDHFGRHRRMPDCVADSPRLPGRERCARNKRRPPAETHLHRELAAAPAVPNDRKLRARCVWFIWLSCSTRRAPWRAGRRTRSACKTSRRTRQASTTRSCSSAATPTRAARSARCARAALSHWRGRPAPAACASTVGAACAGSSVSAVTGGHACNGNSPPWREAGRRTSSIAGFAVCAKFCPLLLIDLVRQS